MKRLFVRSKIHRATVTDANLNYEGSISLCPEMMKSAGILPFEFVHVNNVANGIHWETYAIPGENNQVVLNGPPAHHFKAGDKVIIFTLAELQQHEITGFTHTVVYPEDNNVITFSRGTPVGWEVHNTKMRSGVDLNASL